jgi:hypothetical protein
MVDESWRIPFFPLLGAFCELLYCTSDITEYSALARDSFAAFIHVPGCTSLHHKAKIGVCDRQLGSGVGSGVTRNTYQGDDCSSAAASASICPRVHSGWC